MKKFLLHSILYSTLSIILFIVIFEIVFSPNGFIYISKHFQHKFSWLKVYSRVQASNKSNSFKTLILGDSVASLIFPFNPNKGFLTSNGSVYAAGNFILCKNVIENNHSLKQVVYLSVPNVIGHKFQRSRTCNNFVKPFYEISTFKFFDKNTINDINKNLLNWLYLFKLVKCLPLDEYNYDNGTKKSPFTLSSFSLLYLKKMSEECNKYGIKLTIISPPIPQSRLKHFKKNEKNMILEIKNNNLMTEFQYYFKTIRVLPDSEFKDGLHMKKEYISKNKIFEINRIKMIANQANSADAKSHATDSQR